ncbi:Zinc finger and SCAN domain-containing protein 10 [Orchesella cincta]|uniref:Zinc finger and SCAN domain-containing protein 10 n=1 Tax=Orchesella cincta TaxID=48709 RepID=A0A1D2M856_ORCCI|nr:Zinc finger and SCAN domain-containing protein 10 [Orchesella cincta]
MKLRNRNKSVKTPPETANKSNTSNKDGPTVAAALSAVWNTSKSPSASVASSSKTQTPNKTTCLFCPNAVILGDQTNPNVHNVKLYQLLINLCNHLQINNAEIPSQRCNSTRFPFCTNCESMVVQLWKQQQILEQVLLKIEKLVGDIEYAVVDGEILDRGRRPGSSSMAQAERLKFTKLRRLILDGYRQKLVRRHEQENAEAGNETDSMNDTETELTSSAAADVKQERFEQQSENFTISTDSTQFESPMEEEDELPPSLIRQDIGDPYESYDESQHHSYSDTADSPDDYGWTGDANYSNTNCTMVITNENAETDVTHLIQIKQETHTLATDQYDDDDDDEAGPDIFALEERKRRFLFEGVEIYRASGTGARSKMDYLQCSLCSYSLPIQKHYTSKVSSPYMKMKTHILHVHKKKTGLPKQPRARELSCIPCSKKFSNLKELREHKATHPADGSFECDICRKPFKKGSSQYNLLIHKFSHKNDEERKISLAANERGAYNSMLSAKLSMAYLAGRGRSEPKKRNRKKGKSQPEPIPAPATPITNDTIEDDSGDHTCTVCSRSFRRKCHLIRHMNTHVQLEEQNNISLRRRRQTTENRGTPQVRAAPVLVSNREPSTSRVNLSENTSTDRGQRVAVGDGTVVIVKREVLELLMNN